MGNIIPKKVSFNLPDGKEVTIETGKLATQAHGSVVIKVENTMLLATVVAAKEIKEGQDFFPLSVDYQEKFAAAGKIPGNFFRREAKLSDYEVLVSRLVDRAIRPMFADEFKNETQIVLNLISGDAKNMPDSYAALAASAALCVSDIPFQGPISEVRVAKIDGKYIVNPERQELLKASLDIIISASDDNINMVEGEAKECQEHELLEAIKIGHEAIKVQCAAQKELANLVGGKILVKREVPVAEVDEELKAAVKTLAYEQIRTIGRAASEKADRKEAFDALGKSIMEALLEQYGEEGFDVAKKANAKLAPQKKDQYISKADRLKLAEAAARDTDMRLRINTTIGKD